MVFLGYALTPGLGSFLANADTFVLGIHINKYTAPGAILIGLNAITIVLMLTVYDEHVTQSDGPPDSVVTMSPTASTSTQLTTDVPESLVRIGVAVFIFLNFNARGILSVFETVNIPLFLQVTGNDPTSKTAVIEASSFQFYLGLLGLIAYFSIHVFRHRISDVCWLLVGFFAMGLGNLILTFAPSEMTFARLGAGELFVWSIGCPITTAVVVATFSKILGGRPQGALMGLLGSAASVSRIVLPLLPSVLSSYTPLFLIDTLLCLGSVVALIWYNRRVARWKSTFGKLDEEKELLFQAQSPIHMEPSSRGI